MRTVRYQAEEVSAPLGVIDFRVMAQMIQKHWLISAGHQGNFHVWQAEPFSGVFFFFFFKRTFGFTEISFILFQNPRQTSQTTPIYLGWECLNSLRRSRPSALDNAELHHAVSNVSRLKRQFGADLLPDTNTEQYAAPVCVQSAWSDETQLKTAQKNSWWGSSNIITAKVMETPQAIVIYFPACNTKLRIP